MFCSNILAYFVIDYKNFKMNKNVDAAIAAIEDKKGEEIVVIDMSKTDGSITDAFVICSAQSTTQVDAICNEIDKQLFENIGEKVYRIEGKENGLWIIMDYGDLMVHIFERSTRAFYALEDLWNDVPQKRIESKL